MNTAKISVPRPAAQKAGRKKDLPGQAGLVQGARAAGCPAARFVL